MIKKELRLTTKEFDEIRLQKPQNTYKTPYFVLKIYKNALNLPKIGVVVSKAVDNRSTVRNKLKRLFFDGFEAIINSIEPQKYVIIVNKSAAKVEKNDILSELSKLLTSFQQPLTPNPYSYVFPI